MKVESADPAVGSHPGDDRGDANTVAFSQRTVALQAPMVVSEILDGCLYSGFFGRLDSARMKAVTDTVLESIELYNSEVIIIDLANIDVIDSMVAGHLLRVGETLAMVGVRSIFCGISPIVAQTMVGTGVSFAGFSVVRNLKAALRLVLELDGVTLESKRR